MNDTVLTWIVLPVLVLQTTCLVAWGLRTLRGGGQTPFDFALGVVGLTVLATTFFLPKG